MPREQARNEYPFAEPLRPSEFKDSIKEFKNHPDFTVRPFRALFFIDDYNKYSPDEGKLKSTAEAAAKLKEMHQELSDLGINISAEYVVGKDEKNKENIYVVSDKIAGGDIKEITAQGLDQEEREMLREEFSRLFSGLITYLERRFQDNAPYFSDIFHFRQFKYGHPANSESSVDKIYLIDIEPILNCSFQDLNGYDSIRNSIYDLTQHLAVAERIVGEFPELNERLGKLDSRVYQKDQDCRQKKLEDFNKEQK